VLKTLGFAREQGHAVVALELMSKGSVEGCIREMNANQKVMAILSLTLGLGFIHGQGAVHGALKPSNLLLDGNYHAKLSDFGLDARAPDQITVAYSARERLSGEDRRPTVKSDLYSLGMMIGYIVTGKHLLDPRMGLIERMKAVEAGVEVELPGVKQELVQLVRSLLSVRAEERPRSAKEVFEKICEHEFRFFEDVDAVAIRIELRKFGVVVIPFEPEMDRVRREVAELSASLYGEIARLTRETTAQQQRITALERENASLRESDARALRKFDGGTV
jgi:serine/threonine protein kinase